MSPSRRVEQVTLELVKLQTRGIHRFSETASRKNYNVGFDLCLHAVLVLYRNDVDLAPGVPISKGDLSAELGMALQAVFTP